MAKTLIGVVPAGAKTAEFKHGLPCWLVFNDPTADHGRRPMFTIHGVSFKHATELAGAIGTMLNLDCINLVRLGVCSCELPSGMSYYKLVRPPAGWPGTN